MITEFGEQLSIMPENRCESTHTHTEYSFNQWKLL